MEHVAKIDVLDRLQNLSGGAVALRPRLLRRVRCVRCCHAWKKMERRVESLHSSRDVLRFFLNGPEHAEEVRDFSVVCADGADVDLVHESLSVLMVVHDDRFGFLAGFHLRHHRFNDASVGLLALQYVQRPSIGFVGRESAHGFPSLVCIDDVVGRGGSGDDLGLCLWMQEAIQSMSELLAVLCRGGVFSMPSCEACLEAMVVQDRVRCVKVPRMVIEFFAGDETLLLHVQLVKEGTGFSRSHVEEAEAHQALHELRARQFAVVVLVHVVEGRRRWEVRRSEVRFRRCEGEVSHRGGGRGLLGAHLDLRRRGGREVALRGGEGES
mmetsp:Transcript_4320/g.6525  ORF Transcript_4320/g.6525 Transcript_4320/m.6525 type:complete len:325 (+) Transcript_4320:250-1224(+)